MCLQNSKASGDGNRCHKLRSGEIRAHRCNHYWSSDSEAFTKPNLQHATSLTSLRLREKYCLTNHRHDDSAGFGRSISRCPGGGGEFGDSNSRTGCSRKRVSRVQKDGDGGDVSRLADAAERSLRNGGLLEIRSDDAAAVGAFGLALGARFETLRTVSRPAYFFLCKVSRTSPTNEQTPQRSFTNDNLRFNTR